MANRDVTGWIPTDQYASLRKSRRMKRTGRRPTIAWMDHAATALFLLLVVVIAAVAITWLTGPDEFAATPLPGNRAPGAANLPLTPTEQTRRRLVNEALSKPPAQVFMQTYRELDGGLDAPPATDQPQPKPTPRSAPTITPPPTDDAPSLLVQSASTSPQPAPRSSTPPTDPKSAAAEAELAPAEASPVIHPGPPPSPDSGVTELYVAWPILAPNLLNRQHPFAHWAHRVKQFSYGEASAVIAVAVGPAARGLDDPAYVRFRNDARQKAIDAFAARGNQAGYRFYAPDEPRSFRGYDMHFMYARPDDELMIGCVATLVQDGRAFAYLFDGHGGFYGQFLGSIGEAYLLEAPAEAR